METVLQLVKRRLPAFLARGQRNGERRQDAGKGRMHAGLQYTDPDEHSNQDIRLTPIRFMSSRPANPMAARPSA